MDNEMRYATRDQIREKYGRDAKLALAARGHSIIADGRSAHSSDIHDACRTTAMFFTTATVTDGVVRWNTNDQVPPADILALWDSMDLPFDYQASMAARDVDMQTFLADYRLNQRPLSEETLAEMRAEFGPGAVVVDMISGRRTQL